MPIRAAHSADLALIADIWRAGWIDGHLGHVPDALVAARTADWFTIRAGQNLDATTVAVIGGKIAGFVTVAPAEVEQVYVAEAYRGAGVAAVLLGAAEQQIAAAGHPVAWLAVVAGNMRARRFYHRQGWHDGGAFTYLAAGTAGSIPVPALRYTKPLTTVHMGRSTADVRQPGGTRSDDR